LLQRNEKGDDNITVVAVFFVFCCNVAKKVTGLLFLLPWTKKSDDNLLFWS